MTLGYLQNWISYPAKLRWGQSWKNRKVIKVNYSLWVLSIIANWCSTYLAFYLCFKFSSSACSSQKPPLTPPDFTILYLCTVSPFLASVITLSSLLCKPGFILWSPLEKAVGITMLDFSLVYPLNLSYISLNFYFLIGKMKIIIIVVAISYGCREN